MKLCLQLTWEHENVHCSSLSPSFSLASRCFCLQLFSSPAFTTFRKSNNPLPPDCKADLWTSYHSFSSCYHLSFYFFFSFDHYLFWKCLIICFPKFRSMLPSLFFRFLPTKFLLRINLDNFFKHLAQWINGFKKCSIYTQYYSVIKRRKSCHSQPHEWTLRALC